MMCDRKNVEFIKTTYSKGTRIQVDCMDDKFPVPNGALVTVDHVDDIGTIHCKFDDGRFLGVIVGVDDFHIINDKKEQSTVESATKKLINKLTEAVDEMIAHLGADIQDFDIDEMLEDIDIRSHIVGTIAGMLESRPEVDMVQINDIGVPFQNVITVTPTAISEEQADEPVEIEGQNISM